MISLIFNPSLLKAQNILNKANNSLATSIKRLTTGLRINSAADDPAGYYVAQGLNSQIRGLKQAQNNISMGSSLLSTAEGVMGNMTDMLNRLNDLAIQGANTAMTDTERAALTNEANALLEEIKKQNANTTFNGMNVFGSVSEAVSSNVGVSNVSSDVIPSGYTAIYTAEDLNNVRNNLSGNYILMADIDLSSIDNWEPIGDLTTPFAGKFNGNGHVIKNMKINRHDTNQVGLFGCTAQVYRCEILNVGLENVDVKGNYEVGGLVGTNNAPIQNCYVTGNVSGGDYIGGLVGTNNAPIQNCYVTGNISGRTYIGGLAGNTKQLIKKCYAVCNVSGYNEIGGIVGHLYDSVTVRDSYSTGNVSGDSFVGGIVGKNDKGIIINGYTTGNVSGYTNTGLICGKILGRASLTNVWADKKDSSFGAFGAKDELATITNTRIVEHSEFISPEFWDKQGLDSNVWEMSCSIPPVLKGVGTNNINWYFRESSNENRIQTGSGSNPAANSMTINTGLDLGAMAIDFSTVEGCLNASKCALAALDAIAKRTSTVGASQNRLESASNSNSIMVENLTAAHSNIVNADIAEETANYTMAQIMADTTSALIAQTRAFQVNLLLNMINSLGQ